MEKDKDGGTWKEMQEESQKTALGEWALEKTRNRKCVVNKSLILQIFTRYLYSGCILRYAFIYIYLYIHICIYLYIHIQVSPA